MAVHGNQILVFGGFHDNGRQFRYHNDVYSFCLNDRKWTKLTVVGNGIFHYLSYIIDVGMITVICIPQDITFLACTTRLYSIMKFFSYIM